MSKLDRFKTIAQAAFDPVSTTGAAARPVRTVDRPDLQGTERLRSARLIPLDRIEPDSTQPRKHFSDKSLRELAQSIEAHGVLQPLTVSYNSESDRFTIVTGERRYRAALRVGLSQVPCVIVDGLSEQERVYQQLVENLQREDISPFEEAEAFRILSQRFKLTHQQIAQTVSKNRTYVTKTLGLTRIPEPVRRLCLERGITSREQFTILAQQESEAAMMAFLDQLAEHGQDVRTARRLARSPRLEPSSRRRFEFRYQSSGYVVRVRFTKTRASKRQIAQALREALASLGRE